MSPAAPLLLALALAAPAAAGPGSLRAVTFDEAIALARAKATGSLLGQQEIRRADGLLVQARSGSLPSLAAGGAYTRLDAERTSGGVVVVPEEQKSASLLAALPLSASRWYQWSHAGDQVEVARAGSADAQRSAALTAGRAYLAVVGLRRVVEVSQRAVETNQAHFDFARTRRLAGVGNVLDELRAEQQVASSIVQLEAALAGLARAQEALGQAAGGDAPLDAASEPPLAVPAAVADVDAEVRQRADLKSAGARAQAATRVARDGWADWLPSILGTWQGTRQDWHSSTSPEKGWQAQAILTFPLFEGGYRVGQARERSALQDEAATQLDGLLRQARSEVRSGWIQLQHAEVAFRESQRAADRAGQALTLVTEAYNRGSSNSLDVTDASQRSRDAATLAAVAEDAVRQARLDLLAATGHFP